MNGKNPFAKLNGTPAQILIILGLALASFVPIWTRLDDMRVSRAKGQLDLAGKLIELDLEKSNKNLQAEHELKEAIPGLSLEEIRVLVGKREGQSLATLSKQEELEKTYNLNELKRAWLKAKVDAEGTRSHYLLGWLGTLLLLVGLLALTLQSEGSKQKIVLIILLGVMLSAFAGINRDVKIAYPEQSFSGIQKVISPVAERPYQTFTPPPPPPSSRPPVGGVVGGVIGGIPGGIPGGVLGGIISKSPSTPPPAPVQRIRVSGNVQQTHLISRTQPLYPPIAKAARVQGAVILEATLSKQGTVMNLRVLSGHPLLVQAALDAVKQWRYQPTVLNGQPVEVVTTITVNFTLTEN